MRSAPLHASTLLSTLLPYRTLLLLYSIQKPMFSYSLPLTPSCAMQPYSYNSQTAVAPSQLQPMGPMYPAQSVSYVGKSWHRTPDPGWTRIVVHTSF